MTLLINPVLCRAGTMDNYAYILIDSQTQKSAVVDASEAAPIIDQCERLGVKPDYILTTHHHFDHVGGNQALQEKYHSELVVPETEKELIKGWNTTLSDGEIFNLGETKICAIAAPGHTLGHLLYYVPDEKVLFTGDVLFNLCIGGLFEGTPHQMWQTLQKIKMLPDDVLFYPGHEYTLNCMAQAGRHDSQPMQIYTKIVTERLQKGLPAAPVRLGLEKQCNPYLLIDQENVFAKIF